MDRDDPEPSRRRLLAGVATAAATGLAGCVTTDLSVSAPDVADSTVFDSFSVVGDVAWANDVARVSATLTEASTTELRVRQLAAIDPAGADSWTGEVAGGQTSVTMHLPVERDLTVYAFTAASDPVDSVSLRIEGRRFP